MTTILTAGCRFPGCNARRCDAHHVQHWADGGATRLDNLVLLCRHHHRTVHEEGFTVCVGPTGDTAFCWPDGRSLPEVPSAPRWTGPALAPTEAMPRVGSPAAYDLCIRPWLGRPTVARGSRWLPTESTRPT